MGYLVLQEFSHQFAGLDDEIITASRNGAKKRRQNRGGPKHFTAKRAYLRAQEEGFLVVGI